LKCKYISISKDHPANFNQLNILAELTDINKLNKTFL